MRTRVARWIVALLLVAVASPAWAGNFSVGVRIGGPHYRRPIYPVGIYYRPAPIYVVPPPVLVQPVPVYRPVTVVEPAYAQPIPVATTPALQQVGASPAAAPAVEPNSAEIDRNLRLLNQADDQARADAALELGRLKSRLAVQPLIRLLTTDRSPAVRDAAARGLGLIGDVNGLEALQRSAGADADRDVRRSAQFAAEVLRANYRR